MIHEMLSYPFFIQALLIGFLASIVSGIMGAYIVTKRLSLITGSIAHTTFGGVGMAVYFGINPLFGALVFCVGSAGLIGAIRQRWPKHEDALISAMWAVGMAIGIVLVHLRGGFSGDFMNYLFGNILLTDSMDMLIMIALNVTVIISVLVMYHSFQALTFDEEFAKTRNVPVGFLSICLFILIALTTVALLRVVGIILVITLLSLPAAGALNLSSRFWVVQVVSGIISFISIALGLLTSFHYDLPTGPCIIFAVTFCYCVTFIIKQSAQKLKQVKSLKQGRTQ